MPEQIVYQIAPDALAPGSEDAIRAGCTCPPGNDLYNGNVFFPGGYSAWRVTVGCPVHDAPPAEDVLRLHDPAVLAAKLEQAQAVIANLIDATASYHDPEDCRAEGEAESCPLCVVLREAQEVMK